MNTIATEDLEGLIRRYIVLGKKSPKGYEILKCAKCNDYKPRGGFKFENGNMHYACFNCSCSTGYLANKRVSKEFKSVLVAFGIPESEIDSTVFFSKNEEKPTEVNSKAKVDLPNQAVPLPTGSVSINDDSCQWSGAARQYLKSRCLPIAEYSYFVTDEDSYVGRVIIPYYFREKIIYWQARSMDDEFIQPRYKNPIVEKENIIFNMDEIYRYTDDPLFVTEGPLDALSIGKNAIALAGSTLSEFRFREIQKAASRRRIIFVIDKNKTGYKLGQTALNQNWDVVCFPDNIDDANDALKKLGRLWIISHLVSSAVRGFQGKLLLEINRSKN